MADNSALRAEASNPTTDPARLAAIAHEAPALGAVIAANPAAYDGLLDWLLQYGDDDAKRAVGVRRGAPAPVVAPAAAVAPVAPAASAAPAAGAAPAAAAAKPATPRKPLSPTMKKGLLFGGIGLGAVAVIAVAAIALSNVLGGGGSGSTIQVMDIGSEPRDDAWGIITPMLDDNDLDDDSLVYAAGESVAQDRALVQWTAVDGDFDDVGDSLLSLVNTKNGDVLWTVDWEDDFTVLSAPGATPLLVGVYDDESYIVYSVDAGNGDVISDTESFDNVGIYLSSFFGEPLQGLGGDVIMRSEDGIGRYSPTDFDEEKWLVDLDDDEFASVAGNRVIVGDTAYDLANGEEVDWNADDDLSFFDVGGHILGAETDSDQSEFALYDSAGEEQWSYDGDGSEVAFAQGDLLVLNNTDDEELVAIDLTSGDERWTADFDSDFSLAGGSLEKGFLVGVSGEDGVVIDIANGEEISSFEADDFELQVIGATRNYIYATGNDDGDLIAFALGSGDEVWTLDNPGDYSFSVLGGNIVGFSEIEFDDAEDDAVMIGIQP